MLTSALMSPLPARASGESMTLSHFRDTFLKPYIMSQAAFSLALRPNSGRHMSQQGTRVHAASHAQG